MTANRVQSTLVKTCVFALGNIAFIWIYWILAVVLGPSDGKPILLGIILGMMVYPVFITMPATLGFLASFIFGDNKTAWWLIFIVAGIVGMIGVVWIEDYFIRIPQLAREVARANENLRDFLRISFEAIGRLAYGFVPGMILKAFSDLLPRLSRVSRSDQV